MGLFNMFGINNDTHSDTDTCLKTIGFFVFQHCYLTMSTGTLLLAMLENSEDTDSSMEQFQAAQREISSIALNAKKQLENIMKDISLSSEDVNFFRDFIGIYELLEKRADSILTYTHDFDDSYIALHDTYYNDASEKLNVWVEFSNKMQKNM